MQNDCVFSADRRYRYVLKHTWEPLFPHKLCTWIGLNPSLAWETHLDPTLRRIRAFSASWGFNGFVMLNLFALVSTDPDRIYKAADPVGPDNDCYILSAVQETDRIIAAWGALGGCENRCYSVLAMLAGLDVMCLKETKKGHPIHPLYVAGSTTPKSYIQLVPDIVLNRGLRHNLLYLQVEFSRFVRKQCLIKISHALRPASDHVYPLRRAFSSGIANRRRQCRLPCLARTANNHG